MKNRTSIFFLVVVSVLGVVVEGVQTSWAAVYTYTPANSTTDLWSLGADWSATPLSAASTKLTFVGNNATVLANGLANTNIDDIAGAFSLNIMDLQGTGPASGAATININSSSASNFLNFVSNGTTAPVINLNANAGIAGLTYNVNVNTNLVDNTTFQGSGTANFNINSVISGNGGLTKNGTSTLTLSVANTFTGDTTVGKGTLRLANANALQNSVLIYSMSAGTLDIGALTELNLGGLTGNHALSLTNSNSAAVALTLGGNDVSSNCSNLLSGAGSLTKIGAGTLILSNVNSYAGPTTINKGTLQLSFSNRLPTGTAVTLANVAGASLDLNGYEQTISSLNGGGDAGGNVNLGAGTLFVGSGDFVGVIGGVGGNLTKQTSGTLVLSNASTYTGATKINAGTLRLAAGSGRLPANTPLTLANGAGIVFDMNGQDQTVANLSGGSGSTISLGSGTLTVASGGVTGTINGSGNLIKQGTGLLFLQGNNAYTGSTIVNGGTLLADTPLPSTTAVTVADTSDAMLEIRNLSQTIASLSGGGRVHLTSYYTSGDTTLTVGDGHDTTYSGIISDSFTNYVGKLVKQGTGILTLSGASVYHGSTTINAGTLRLAGGDDRLPVRTALVLQNTPGALLDLNGQKQSVQTLNGGGANGGNINLGTGTLTVNNGTYAGVISGIGGHLCVRYGTFIIAGANTYTGTTIIDSGTLRFSGDNRLPADSAVTFFHTASGAVLDLHGYSQTIAALDDTEGGSYIMLGSGTLTVRNCDDTKFWGRISGTGGKMIKQGTGTMTLLGTNTYTGGTTINDGTLALGIDNALPSAADVILNGGTLATDVYSQTNVLGKLKLSGNSIIDMGVAGSSILQFAASSSVSWTDTLAIANWNGSWSGGMGDELFFGWQDSGLTSTQLSHIVFTNPNGLLGDYQAKILSTGEVVPVPEPSTVVLLLSGGLLMAGFTLRQQRRIR